MSSNADASENLQELPDSLKRFYKREFLNHSLDAMAYTRFMGPKLTDEQYAALQKVNQRRALNKARRDALHNWRRRNSRGMAYNRGYDEGYEEGNYNADY